jgi:DNA-damage-inducible protein D
MAGIQGYQQYVKELDKIARIAISGAEYWLGRELQPLLAYASWDKFQSVIAKAIESCRNAGFVPERHFSQTGNMIVKGGTREKGEWFLSRYACYLIAMEADSSKPEVAFAKTYFATQTHRQETQEKLTQSERRLELRRRVKDANRSLTNAASGAGVQNFAVFNDAGYKGLYGGLGVSEIKELKGIPVRENLLDRAGLSELAANMFRITQADDKIRREEIKGQERGIDAHHSVGKEVRDTIRKIGGTMPEKLKPEPPIKTLTGKQRKGILPKNELSRNE